MKMRQMVSIVLCLAFVAVAATLHGRGEKT